MIVFRRIDPHEWQELNLLVLAILRRDWQESQQGANRTVLSDRFPPWLVIRDWRTCLRLFIELMAIVEDDAQHELRPMHEFVLFQTLVSEQHRGEAAGGARQAAVGRILDHGLEHRLYLGPEGLIALSRAIATRQVPRTSALWDLLPADVRDHFQRLTTDPDS